MNNFASLTGFVDNINAVPLQSLEDTCWQWSLNMGFAPIRLPLVEERDLFERGVGNGTDVVEKEMFSLADTSAVLRPEGTAPAMRAWLAAGAQRLGPVRWAYCGPMFRNERPQAGRFRQFQQFGCEMISQPEGASDADLLIGMADLFTQLGVLDRLVLRINTIGTSEERKNYREALVAWLTPRYQDLDEVSQRRLSTNPLRIWDSKDARTKEVMQSAPRLRAYLGTESLASWERLLTQLNEAGVAYVIDDALMRGLDYYNGLVFEWTTFEDKAQNAVAAGGRYDGLSALLGGPAVPAIGFALGLDRVLLQMPAIGAVKRTGYFVAPMAGCDNYALRVARVYRAQGNQVVIGDSRTKLAKQVQRADKNNMRYVLILGEAERDLQQLTVKDLETGAQQTCAFEI